MTKSILLLLLFAACAAVHPAPTTSPALIGQRALMIQWLAEYERAGVFPTDDRDMPLSVFRDAHGVRCPMAELIYRSGHADLVDAVARDHNTLRLADVHDGPLLQWMETSGLTRDEIVMIQGALTIDEMHGLRRYAEQQALKVAAATGQVHGKIAMAVTALRIAKAPPVALRSATPATNPGRSATREARR